MRILFWFLLFQVIKSQLTGGYLYQPTLWYYTDMQFLDDLNDPNNTETTVLSVENANDDEDDDEDVCKI